jgi:hypothetical protein
MGQPRPRAIPHGPRYCTRARVAKRGALCVDELWGSHVAGAKPEYSYWDGKKYGYVAARKRIYAPLYASLVGDPLTASRLAPSTHYSPS